jgi:ComF family protein
VRVIDRRRGADKRRAVEIRRWLQRAGPCAACRRPRGAPLCDACVRGSLAECIHRTRIGASELYFVGAYHSDRRGMHGLSPLGRALAAFKDRGDRYAGRCLTGLFANACRAAVAGNDVIVPVPPDRSRLRARGYSPAGWLAWSLARNSGIRLCTSAVERTDGHVAQRHLGGQARRRNAAGVFVRGRTDVRGLAVVIVDDVVTTGATLLDARRCLDEAGARRIVCFALACADEELLERCPPKTEPAGMRGTEPP